MGPRIEHDRWEREFLVSGSDYLQIEGSHTSSIHFLQTDIGVYHVAEINNPAPRFLPQRGVTANQQEGLALYVRNHTSHREFDAPIQKRIDNQEYQ